MIVNGSVEFKSGVSGITKQIIGLSNVDNTSDNTKALLSYTPEAQLTRTINSSTDKNKVMIALSGGVDSAVVAYAAFQALGKHAIAVTADYKTLSQEELLSAKKVCSEIGIEQMILDYSELENEEFVKNDSNRCFHCRMELGDHLIKLAKK